MQKILLIDDEPDLIAITSQWLKSWGFDVVAATTAEAALVILKHSKPDLIMLDLRLPQMQGEQLCAKLKSSPEFKHIPVVIFTATTDKVDEKTRGCGADDFVVKPFKTGEIRRKITRLLLKNSLKKSKAKQPGS